jgi:prepilin-type N-terminal cleavage/methylation domain-containing protein
MKGLAKKGSRKGEKGFTLVELLIVFTLLGVLAAIMIPNVTGLIQYGHDQAAAAEWDVVQTAIDTMMAKENITAVNQTSPTKDMSAFPNGGPFLYPNYLRDPETKGTYSCETDGNVSQNTSGY